MASATAQTDANPAIAIRVRFIFSLHRLFVCHEPVLLVLLVNRALHRSVVPELSSLYISYRVDTHYCWHH